MTTQPLNFRPLPRPSFRASARERRAFVLFEMMIAIALFSIFSVAAMRLISSSLRIANEVSRAEDTHRAFDSALARLRADVWTAAAVAVGGPTGATMDLGGDRGSVTWNVGSDGALVRTVSPAGAYPERLSWPTAGAGVLFRAEPAGLTLDVPTGRGHDNGTYRLYSQVLLAKERQ